ncbi:MAG TPA: helix-turn-helix domain-containing protein [Pseudonocardia sp.]|jgi:AcrR family transcriptional regulator
MTEPDPRRRRRSSAELRALLLDVARDLFDRHGFQATTTAEISRKAGVSERVLFNQFASKSALFNAAVIAPFVDLVSAYVDEWVEEGGDDTPERRLDRFVGGLYDLARQHRTALLTALVEHQNGEANELLDQLARALRRMQTITPEEAYRDQYRGLDMPALSADTVGMIFGVALLDDLIFPARTRRPSRKRLTDEMRTLLLDGMRHRGPTSAT